MGFESRPGRVLEYFQRFRTRLLTQLEVIRLYLRSPKHLYPTLGLYLIGDTYVVMQWRWLIPRGSHVGRVRA
jgi:hypothetical protein